MSLKRILKFLAAVFTAQGIAVVAQLLVPPLFLRRYAHGVERYGEWIALTAAVSYLNTLNAGIQTYSNNQMTIHHNRGELEEAKSVQASAVRLCLALTFLVGIGGISILFMPLSGWLGLRYISSSAASLTVFLMALQLVVGWFFYLLTNSFMVVGELHRGANWQSAQRLVSTLGLSGFLWFGASFPVLAATQLLVMILFSILASVDIRIHAPLLLPSLRYGSWGQVISILKPSGYFLLGGLSSFLWWQGPVLLIEKLLGPVAVAIFALTRTVFNMSRQAMVAMTYAISQDITRLVGQENWTQLRRLYDLSEKVVLLIVPTATVGTLLLCPSLFAVWLHKRTLYVATVCLLMAMISAVMGIKEHKMQFQTSSNQHQDLVRFTVASYCVMVAASLPVLRHFGIAGLQIVWLLTEIVQVMYILRLNLKLFPREINVSVTPVLRLAVVLVLGFGLAAWPVYHNSDWSTVRVWSVAFLITLILTVICYFSFGLKDVRRVVAARLRHRAVAVD